MNETLPDTGRARFRCNKTDIIARSKFAQHEENSVNNDEATNVLGLGEPWVAACHDEANDSLQHNTDEESLLWPHTLQIRNEGSSKTAGEVEEVDEDVPRQAFPQWLALSEQIIYDSCRVDTETISGKIINEPG